MWTRPQHPLDRLAFIAVVGLMATIAINKLVPDAALIVSAFFN